jgi:hypothetical protein
MNTGGTMVRYVAAWLAKVKRSLGSSQSGFSLVEVLIAGVVVVVGLIFLAQFFSTTATRVLASDTRSLMSQIATEEIETIRAMQYADVGTVGGQPSGLLPAESVKVVEGRNFNIVREVTYIQDSSYTGPYPANYRRATVIVSATDNAALAPVSMSTNVAGGALGGTLDITVSDTAGSPVASARLTITNNILSPHVLINASAIRTDDDGHLQVPGLTPDANNGYFVKATKAGYNDAALKQGVVVTKGVTTVVQLIVDKLATMTIHLTDPLGTPLANVALKVTGYQSVDPWTFEETVTTDANGNATLSDIRYSSSVEPYFIELVTPRNPPLQLPTGVDAPPIAESFLPLPDGKIPVLLGAGENQEVDLWISNGPGVTNVSPNWYWTWGGVNVVITGNNFTGATAVKFGATGASFVVNSDTMITAVAPAGSGLVDITVTTPLGTSAQCAADHFTYWGLQAPTVTAVSPTTGVRTGGTTVIITGTNFAQVTKVTFGGTDAAFTVNSTTRITATAPAHANGTVDVIVTNSAGSSANTSADNFKYVTHL